MIAHIVRIDAGGSHGWQARFNASHYDLTKYESKLFSDKPCGGKRKARRQAEEFLRAALLKHGIDFVPSGRRKGMKFIDDPDRVCSSNSSGRTGVYRGEHERRLAGGKQRVRYWAASYTIGPDGKKTRRSKRFYFGTERTEEEAWELALRFREGWEDAFLTGGSRGVRTFFKEWVS